MEGAIIFGMESKGFIPTERLDKSQQGYGQKQIKVGVEWREDSQERAM